MKMLFNFIGALLYLLGMFVLFIPALFSGWGREGFVWCWINYLYLTEVRQKP
jgi:hypothetical protein